MVRARLSRIALTLLVLLFGATTLTACKGSCRQLSEKLCQCSRNSLERDACLRRASSEESRITVEAQHEAVCASLLDKCDCNLIDTPQGKKDCGLSR